MAMRRSVADPREKASSESLLLQAGAHEYDFQYPLPRALPTSFESQDPQFKGRVHYFLHAKLESPDDSLRQHREKVFLVLSHLDLNKDPRVSVSGRNSSLAATEAVNNMQLPMSHRDFVNIPVKMLIVNLRFTPFSLQLFLYMYILQ